MGDIRPHTRLLDKHDYIYRAGDSYTALYVVKAGCVKSFTTSESGEKQVLGFYLPGEIIGFDGIAKNQHNANAVAVDIGAVCEIPAAKLHVLAGHNAEVATTMFKWCATELGRMQRFAQSIATRSATARMAGFLLDISDYYGARGFSPVRFTLPMARTDIGRHLGLAAETVSRTINRLRADAIADVHRQDVSNNDLDGLRRVFTPSL